MKPLFSIVPFELIVEDVKEPLLIFDLPVNLVVSLDDIEIPSQVFDYFNPLIVDPDGLGLDNPKSLRYGKLVFYYRGESEPVKRFTCYRLVLERSDPLIAILESTIHYPPNFDIDYRTLTVSRTLRMHQLCDIFEKIQTIPQIPHPMPHYRGLPMAPPGPLPQLFHPAPPNPSFFLNPESEMIMVFQANDSDRENEDYDDDEESDDSPD